MKTVRPAVALGFGVTRRVKAELALLNPIGEYNHRMDPLLKDGLSTTDARKELEAKEPDLVLARDNQVVIQRRSQLSAERQASAHEKKRSQRP